MVYCVGVIIELGLAMYNNFLFISKEFGVGVFRVETNTSSKSPAKVIVLGSVTMSL